MLSSVPIVETGEGASPTRLVPPAGSTAPAGVTVSVVSHGDLTLVQGLLKQLVNWHGGCVRKVIVTHNLPDSSVTDLVAEWPFQLVQLQNEVPLGFGANHNQAFRHCETPYFCVINPDIRLLGPDVWTALLDALAQPRVGCAYPTLLNADGSVQDSEREAVTVTALMRRRLLGLKDRRVDWVNAAFLVFSTEVYRALRGFDEGYFLYCEDVDLCLRLRLAGWQIARANVRAEHEAQRGTLRQPRHLAWHLKSLWRLWRGQILPAYLKIRDRQ